MAIEWCQECWTHHINGEKCYPLFEVQQQWRSGEEPDDDAWSSVRARDAEEAVERWADRHDSEGDYTIIGGSEATVFLRHPEEGPAITKWRVSGEAVPQYTARKIEEEKKG